MFEHFSEAPLGQCVLHARDNSAGALVVVGRIEVSHPHDRLRAGNELVDHAALLWHFSRVDDGIRDGPELLAQFANRRHAGTLKPAQWRQVKLTAGDIANLGQCVGVRLPAVHEAFQVGKLQRYDDALCIRAAFLFALDNGRQALVQRCRLLASPTPPFTCAETVLFNSLNSLESFAASS